MVRLLTAAVCVAALAALAASSAATAVCAMHGPRWGRSDTPAPEHGSLYDVGYTQVTRVFAAAWSRKVASDVAKFESVVPGGPPGFQCRNLGDTKGPSNIGGTVIMGSCSNAPAGKYFAWRGHGY